MPISAIDWTNVIEEIRDVGLSELRACGSFLTQAMVHLLKLRAWPQSQAVGLWRDETRRFLDDAAERFTPSMRQRIALDLLYARALRRVMSLVQPRYFPKPVHLLSMAFWPTMSPPCSARSPKSRPREHRSRF